MKKTLKTILFVCIGTFLVIYAGYKLGLFSASNQSTVSKNVSNNSYSSSQNFERGSSSTVQEQIYDSLDSGMESSSSKTEEVQSKISAFEKSLECFYVTSVVDGDTIWVSNDNYPDGIKIRYIGIDTPESALVEDQAYKNTNEGKVASKRNEEIIAGAGNNVYLEYGKEREDKYGRTLAYVYIYDWSSNSYDMIEEILLSEGLCDTMAIEPNTKYEKEFTALRDTAKKNKAGFWGTGFYK